MIEIPQELWNALATFGVLSLTALGLAFAPNANKAVVGDAEETI